MSKTKYTNYDNDQLFSLLERAINGQESAKHLKNRKLFRKNRKEINNELLGRGLSLVDIEDGLDALSSEDHSVEEGVENWEFPTKANLKYRIMYVEHKGGALEGEARIGKVYFSKSGKSLYYLNKRFQRMNGFKANYFDVDTGDEYWISGPKKDRNDRLYGGQKGVVIDDDIYEEYLAIIESEI